jgi:hypothetical protein
MLWLMLYKLALNPTCVFVNFNEIFMNTAKINLDGSRGAVGTLY